MSPRDSTRDDPDDSTIGAPDDGERRGVGAGRAMARGRPVVTLPRRAGTSGVRPQASVRKPSASSSSASGS